MEQATELLVIITSSVLIVFLLASIFLIAQILLVVRHIKHLAEKAETVADSVESIGAAFQEAAQSRKAIKILNKIITTLTTNRK